MHELKRVKAVELFKLVNEIIDDGGLAWITVTGMSMYPFLRDGKDSVELCKPSFDKLKKGDIVLIKRNNGLYILHRLLKKEMNCIYIIGDAQQWVEGPIKPDQIYAVVTRIKRVNRIINCSNPILKTFVSIWLYLIPFRHRIIKNYSLIRKQMNKVLKNVNSTIF